jgi:hypothetical protein
MLYSYQITCRGTQQPIDRGEFEASDVSAACIHAQTVPVTHNRGEAFDVRVIDAAGADVWSGPHLRSR